MADLIFARLGQEGIELASSNIELLGAGDGVPGLTPPPADLREVVLRISACDPRREAVEAFSRQFATLITNGPAGLAGYAQGRPVIRPVYSYWPSTIPQTQITPTVTVQTATDWAKTPSSATN